MSPQFLLGIVATIGTAAGAWVAFVAYRNSRAGIVVVVRPHKFDLPDHYDVGIDSLVETLRHYCSLPPQPADESASMTDRLLDALANTNEFLLEARTYRHPSLYWDIEVRNSGKHRAEEVAVQVPGAIVQKTSRGGRKATLAAADSIIELGTVRPGEVVNLSVWGNHEFGSISVLQKSGRGRVDLQGLVGARWKWFVEFWEIFRWPVFWLTLMSAVIALIQAL